MALTKDFYVTLRINGQDYGAWDTIAGGELDHDEQKYTPADGVQRVYLGNPMVGNITLTRDYRPERDGLIERNRDNLAGKSCIVVVQDKDRDGNFQQNRPPYTGLLKTITPPDTDSDATDVAKISIEITSGAVT